MLFALTGHEGICTGVVQMDEICAKNITGSDPDVSLVPLTQSEYDAIRLSPDLFRRIGGRWFVIRDNQYHEERDFYIPHDERLPIIKKRALVLQALDGYDFPSDPAPPSVPMFSPVKSKTFVKHKFDNGVSIDHANRHQFMGAVQCMRDSRHYKNRHNLEFSTDLWFRDPDGWFLAYSWNGQDIQYEHLFLNKDSVTFGFTQHVMRERPSWFWRLHQQPVMEQLVGHGFKHAVANIMADEGDYVPTLKRNYGAIEDGRSPDGSIVKMRYDLEAVAKQVPYSPERRTIDGWEFPQSGVSVIEADDVAAAREMVKASWKGSSRTDEALRMFDERVHLDKATVLVGRSNAVDPVVYVVRERTSDTSSMSCLVPWSDHPHHGLIAQGVIDWHAQAGYNKATTFWVPKRLDHPLTQKMMKRFGAQLGVTRTYGGQTWHESVVDVGESMKRSSAAWAD